MLYLCETVPENNVLGAISLVLLESINSTFHLHRHPNSKRNDLPISEFISVIGQLPIGLAPNLLIEIPLPLLSNNITDFAVLLASELSTRFSGISKLIANHTIARQNQVGTNGFPKIEESKLKMLMISSINTVQI